MRTVPNRKRHSLTWIFLCASFCLMLVAPATAQKRDYGDGPLKWKEDFKLTTPPDFQYDAWVKCDLRLDPPTKDATSSGGKRGVPRNDCIECKNKCTPDQQGKRLFKMKQTKKCRVKVKAFIEQNLSAKPKDKQKQTDALLAHEQGHFDLWEATARAAEKKINEEGHCIKAVNCKLDGKNAFRAHINVLFQEARTKGAAINKKYDDETEHGTKTEEQEKWKKKIKKLLSIKGGPSWDQITSLVSTGAQGGEGKKPNETNYPITPLTFSEVTLHNTTWSNGPVTLVMPPMVFENHEGTHSRLWAYDSRPVIAIHDEDFNPVASADFSAFFGNENDTEFRTTISGPTAYPNMSDQEPVPIDPEAPPVVEEDGILETTQLIIKFNQPLGEVLAGMGPYEAFEVTFEIGRAPAEPPPGDVNYDGVVDAADIEALIRVLAGEEVIILPQTGDLDGDGLVTEADLEALMAMLDGTSPDGGMD